MHNRIGLVVPVMVASLLLQGVASADHVPSRKRTPDGSRAQVESRLVDLGYSPEAAVREISTLTTKEIAFFSGDASRVQLVAGLTSEEFLVGGGWLGGILLATMALASGAKTKKD